MVLSENKPLVFVAPLVGAWSEIHMLLVSEPTLKVAPLVGAWIEIVSFPHA